jgi:hypothetical protein
LFWLSTPGCHEKAFGPRLQVFGGWNTWDGAGTQSTAAKMSGSLAHPCRQRLHDFRLQRLRIALAIRGLVLHLAVVVFLQPRPQAVVTLPTQSVVLISMSYLTLLNLTLTHLLWIPRDPAPWEAAFGGLSDRRCGLQGAG